MSIEGSNESYSSKLQIRIQEPLKVYDYLVETPASTQRRGCVDAFVQRCKDFELTKADILNTIDLRPCNIVDLQPLVENLDHQGNRYGWTPGAGERGVAVMKKLNKKKKTAPKKPRTMRTEKRT